MGAAANLMLIATATRPTILRLFVWMALGLVVYAAYGHKHSHLRRRRQVRSRHIKSGEWGGGGVCSTSYRRY